MKYKYLIVLISLLVSCDSNQSKNRSASLPGEHATSYAAKFKIYDGHLEVLEPWPGAVRSITYKLGEVPQRIVVTSTTHLPYLEMLGIEDRLVGFPSTKYISSPKIRKLVNEGKITDLGPDGNMNLELLLSLEPDMVFAFDMGNESTTLDKIQESGIPVVYNADFLETSTLGRAEWLRFYGAFFDLEEKADSIFTSISTRYDSLRNLVEHVEHKPTILSGVMYGDAWFLPGGNNWSAAFFKDAGGSYLWAENAATGWLEVSFETVFDKAHNADFWIGISTHNSLDELVGQDERYADFEAFKQKNIYNYNKRLGPSGGYDFFESGYARPDLVLADLIRILHPDKLPGYETYYFQKIP